MAEKEKTTRNTKTISNPFKRYKALEQMREKRTEMKRIAAEATVKACLASKGVAEMVDTPITEDFSRVFSGQPGIQGVKIDVDEGFVIDVFLNVVYGYKIPEVAWDIQENVKKAVEAACGIKIEKVNINIQGVYCENIVSDVMEI